MTMKILGTKLSVLLTFCTLISAVAVAHGAEVGQWEVFTGKEEILHVVKYTGNNPLRKHGILRVSADQRHFEYADGTAFFWLGDTWWKGLCKRLSWEGC